MRLHLKLKADGKPAKSKNNVAYCIRQNIRHIGSKPRITFDNSFPTVTKTKVYNMMELEMWIRIRPSILPASKGREVNGRCLCNALLRRLSHAHYPGTHQPEQPSRSTALPNQFHHNANAFSKYILNGEGKLLVIFLVISTCVEAIKHTLQLFHWD